MEDLISVDAADGVQTIRLNRPEKSNAFTFDMYEMAADAMALAEHDGTIRAVVIAGTPGVFTSGHDVDDLARQADERGLSASTVRFMKTLAMLDKPIVAAVDGLAMGIGTTMLFHCDFVVASEWSVFSSPCVDIGMPPEAGASLLAPQIMGYHLAFELLVMGEHFDAQRALAAGLVNRVVSPDEVEEAAIGYAHALAAKPRQAVHLARRLMRGDRRDVVSRINVETSSFADLLRSPSALDALQAYIDSNRT